MIAATPSAGFSALRQRTEQAARLGVVGLGFSVCVSTALDGVLTVVLLAAWCASGDWTERLRLVRANPVALAALGLLGVLAVGLLWSEGPVAERTAYFRKYLTLLLIPVVATLMTRPQDRRNALLALAAGLSLTLAVSLAMGAGMLPEGGVLKGTADNPSAFKKHITHSLFLAFGCLLFLQFAREASERRWRWLWGLAAMLAAFDVLFLVQGRTGYLVLLALLLFALAARFRWQGAVAAVILAAVAVGAAYELSSSFRGRVDQAARNVERFQPGARGEGAVGERLEFYDNTLAIIRAHPLVGVGTGDFASAYAYQVQGTDMRPTSNPHNQYLLVAAQTGVFGLGALLLLFVVQWRAARRLAAEGDRLLAHGLVITFVVGSLFNSLLLDHAEGLLFAWLSGVLYAGLGAESARA